MNINIEQLPSFEMVHLELKRTKCLAFTFSTPPELVLNWDQFLDCYNQTAVAVGTSFTGRVVWIRNIAFWNYLLDKNHSLETLLLFKIESPWTDLSISRLWKAAYWQLKMFTTLSLQPSKEFRVPTNLDLFRYAYHAVSSFSFVTYQNETCYAFFLGKQTVSDKRTLVFVTRSSWKGKSCFVWHTKWNEYFRKNSAMLWPQN